MSGSNSVTPQKVALNLPNILKLVISPCGRSCKYLPNDNSNDDDFHDDFGSTKKQEQQKEQEQPNHEEDENTSLIELENFAKHKKENGNKKIVAGTVNRSSDKSTRCDKCHAKIYPTDPTIRAFNYLFHSQCFQCCLCHMKLVRSSQEVCVTLPPTPTCSYDVSADSNEDNILNNNNDKISEKLPELYLLCVPCQEKSQHTYSDKVTGTTAGDKITIDDNELGDVDGVMDEIGEDLEQILLSNNYIPKCTICGGNFLNYQNKVVMLGQMKYHTECWTYGKPCLEVMNRRQSPLMIAQSLPSQLIIKFYHAAANNKQQVTTMFFLWTTRLEDFKQWQSAARQQPLKVIDIQYMIDPKPLSHKTIPYFFSNYTDDSNYRCDIVGNPFGDSIQSATQQPSYHAKQRTWTTTLSFIKCELQHSIQVQIPVVNHESGRLLNLTKAQLTVTIVEEEEQFAQRNTKKF